jgi:hypothetical protein
MNPAVLENIRSKSGGESSMPAGACGRQIKKMVAWNAL